MPQKELPSSDRYALSFERLESRTMLSLAPAGVDGLDFDPGAELPCVVEMADVVHGPASTNADAGLDTADDQAPTEVVLPATCQPSADDAEHGPPEDLDPAGPPDEVPPDQVGDHDNAGPPEEVASGEASTNAAEGLGTATNNVPESIALPEASQTPGDDGDHGPFEDDVPGPPVEEPAVDGLETAEDRVPDCVNLPEPNPAAGDGNGDHGPPADLIPGPASERAADGLVKARENVPIHVILPESTRPPGENNDHGPPEDVIPGPASEKAADGLAKAAANVEVHENHVTLPPATRLIGRQDEDDPS